MYPPERPRSLPPLGDSGPGGDAPRASSFWLTVTAIALVGLGVRLLATFVFLDYRIAGDALYYHGQANALARGQVFVDGILWLRDGATRASALHPPLYSAVLSVVSRFGGTSEAAHRAASCLLGTATIPVLALLGRRLGGFRVGVTIAALTALSPALWIADTQLLSEGLYALAIAVTLLASYAVLARPTALHAAWLGGAAALAALTRGEALLLFPFLVVPVVLRARTAEPRRDRLRALAAAGLVGALLIGPWITYNSSRFGRFSYSNNSGAVVMIANCDATYRGVYLGYWSAGCYRPETTHGGEAASSATAMRIGTQYARDHLARLPVAMLARLGRALGAFRVSQTLSLEASFEGRGVWQARAALVWFYALVALAVPGLRWFRRRALPLLPLLLAALLTLVGVALSYGNSRFRIPLDVALTVLGGAGVVRLWELVSPRERHASALPDERARNDAPE